MMSRAVIAALFASSLALAAGCASEPGTSAPFRDAGPMDAALAFDVVRFDVIRSDRGPMTRPEVLDFTDVDPLPGQLDATPMDRPCATQLPGEYRVYPEGPSLRFDDRITLGPPRRFRFERRVPGSTTPLVCETSIPACGAAFTKTPGNMQICVSTSCRETPTTPAELHCRRAATFATVCADAVAERARSARAGAMRTARDVTTVGAGAEARPWR